jgi:hypothetical protein
MVTRCAVAAGRAIDVNLVAPAIDDQRQRAVAADAAVDQHLTPVQRHRIQPGLAFLQAQRVFLALVGDDVGGHAAGLR